MKNCFQDTLDDSLIRCLLNQIKVQLQNHLKLTKEGHLIRDIDGDLEEAIEIKKRTRTCSILS